MKVFLQSLCVGLLSMAVVGCSGGDPAANSAQATASTANEAGAAANSSQDPIAAAAEEFLAAVVQGDTPRATRMLTPDAIAQFAASQQGFASPEIGAPKFRVEQVRKVADDKAAVQCILTDDGGDAEMCCLLRRVGSDWRVSGVAYEVSPGQPPIILNFENPEPSAPTRPAGQRRANPQYVDQNGLGSPAVRTAAEPLYEPVR
ncbi:MAG: hypothetical protein AAGF31_05810 [Planctomycetota bacterium]